MGEESLFPDEAKVTKGMVDAARWLRQPRVLMGHTVGSKHRVGSEAPGNAKLHWCHRAAPHEVLFSRSAVSVHHGRVGTAVAAFRAGVPKRQRRSRSTNPSGHTREGPV